MSVYLRREVDTKESSLIRRLINKAGVTSLFALKERKYLNIKIFTVFPGSFPRLRIFKIDVSISFTDLLQAVVKNDNMADCFSCSAW